MYVVPAECHVQAAEPVAVAADIDHRSKSSSLVHDGQMNGFLYILST